MGNVLTGRLGPESEPEHLPVPGLTASPNLPLLELVNSFSPSGLNLKVTPERSKLRQVCLVRILLSCQVSHTVITNISAFSVPIY